MARGDRNPTPGLMAIVFVLTCVLLMGVLLYSRSLVTYLAEEMELNIQAWLRQTSMMGASLATADELKRYQNPEDMSLEDYQALRRKLAGFAADSGVLYVYYLRPAGDGMFQFIVDNDFNEETRVGLDTPPSETALTPGLTKALSGQVSSTDLGSYMTGWEGLLSAYAPIFDEEGNVAAVCGVDVNDEVIYSARQRERQLGILSLAATAAALASGAFCLAGYRQEAKAERKAKEATEEFMRGLISAGREYYKKMDEMETRLRQLRHDYKYHLNAAREMLRGGDPDGAGNYLTTVESKLPENELPYYCPNPVINALVAGYAERCARLGIEFKVGIEVLETLSVPNYELCIIVGNLLENAVTASEKLSEGREIELAARSTGAQFILMVKNRFDGRIETRGAAPGSGAVRSGTPKSSKADGGIGLRSVRAVAEQYGGETTAEWDDKFFTVYVTVKT